MASLTTLGCSCTGASPSTSCSFLSGNSSLKVDRGVARVSCRKAEIHPKWFSEAKVFCNGELVMTTGGTQEEYVVDIWSGNHPYFQGSKNTLLLDRDRVDKFKQRYGMMGGLSEVPVLQGEVVFEKKKKPPVKGKGGGKKK